MHLGFFYETVAPLLIVGNTSLLCIRVSTLTSEINFCTRQIRMRDKVTNLNKPIFTVLSIQLACEACREQAVTDYEEASEVHWQDGAVGGLISSARAE